MKELIQIRYREIIAEELKRSHDAHEEAKKKPQYFYIGSTLMKAAVCEKTGYIYSSEEVKN